MFYSYTLRFVYLEAMLNFCRHSYFMGWMEDSIVSRSLLSADTQKNMSSPSIISSSGFLEDLKKVPDVLELICLPLTQILPLFIQHFVKGSQTLLLSLGLLELLHKEVAQLCYFLLVGRGHRKCDKRNKIFSFFFFSITIERPCLTIFLIIFLLLAQAATEENIHTDIATVLFAFQSNCK